MRPLVFVTLVAGCAAPSSAPLAPTESAPSSPTKTFSAGPAAAPFVTASVTQVLMQPDLGGASILVADFDRDGRADVLVSTAWDPIANTPGALRLFAGHGDGTLAAPRTRAIGGLFATLAGDLDGDGRPDLVTDTDVLSTSGAWRAQLNQGDGTFVDAFDAPLSTLPSFPVVADFDGDGRADLSFAGENAPRSVLLARAGSFAAQQTPWGNAQVVAGDFDRDGRVDLVQVNESGILVFARGMGDGTFPGGNYQRFAADRSCPIDPVPCDRVRALAAADVDGDGVLDLIVSLTSARHLLYGIGDGRFTPDGAGVPGGEWRLWVADFDGDGHLDLLAGDIGTKLLLFDGAPFQRALPFPRVNDQDLTAAGIGDFDGDGRPDVAGLSATSDGGLVVTIQLNRF
jgi:hypothetical protein